MCWPTDWQGHCSAYVQNHCVCAYVYAYVCAYVFAYVFAYVCAYVCSYVFAYVYVYAYACIKKETGCTGASAADTFDL